jgi:hypothetical protein
MLPGMKFRNNLFTRQCTFDIQPVFPLGSEAIAIFSQCGDG